MIITHAVGGWLCFFVGRCGVLFAGVFPSAWPCPCRVGCIPCSLPLFCVLYFHLCFII